MPKRILLAPLGSFGDVNPFLWMGRVLRDAGHDVRVILNPVFAPLAQNLDLPHATMGTEDEYHAVAKNPELWHPSRGSTYVLRQTAELTSRHFAAIAKESEGAPPLLLAPCIAFGARLAREKLGLTLVTVNLQPGVLFSAHETPTFGFGIGFLRHLPPRATRGLLALARIQVNVALRPGIESACREQGVPAPSDPFGDWWQSPDGVICLFSKHFASPQRDWPWGTRCVGFPLEDLSGQIPVDPACEQFLSGGPPPILFTPGTAMAFGRRFFRVALEACAKGGWRGIFLTRFPDQLPPGLPPTIRTFDYVPLSAVLPRCAAIVHHGGIGTTSQALAAGIPQLIMPMAHDQPDNATRVRDLGLGARLWPFQFHPGTVFSTLNRLLNDEPTHRRCREFAARIRSENPGRGLLEALAFKLRQP